MAKRQFVYCSEFDVVYDPERGIYTLNDRYLPWGETPLEVGQKVTLAVIRKKGRKKLLKCVVLEQIDDCTCGSCDYLVKLVAVQTAFIEEHKETERKKFSFSEWEREKTRY